MARIKRGVTARARHKKILKLAKGYYGARRKVFRVAKQAVKIILGWFGDLAGSCVRCVVPGEITQFHPGLVVCLGSL